ncbi:MAG: phospholipase D-like domain-containing protein [Oligoflexia bacterium]|nr:phospholipase D-like domain-containing protein [Oligoflexia bacterium]
MVNSRGILQLSRKIAVSALTLLAAQLAFAYPVQLANSPDSNLALTTAAINSAQQSLLINIYDLSSSEIVQAIINQVNRGVHVELLQEGQPVGGISAAARGLQSGLIQAMSQAAGSDRYVEMSSRTASGDKVKRRFRYDHAKYIVVDSSSLLIGSENYSPTGQPEPGTTGNRGWEVWLQDSEVAQEFASMFASDSDPSNQDIQNLLGMSGAIGSGNGSAATPPTRHPRPKKPVKPKDDFTSAEADLYSANGGNIVQADASAVAPLASPVSSQQGLLNLLNSAQSSIMIEQMELQPQWKQNGSSSSSPLMDAILAAARRGVHVSVLLNDERVFAHGGKVDSKNTDAITALNNAASSEGLPVEARTANLKAMGVTYIHNKGALVDGQQTLISSINWDQNSIQNNRETAVVLTSADVYNYYYAAFQSDWNNSGTADSGGDLGNGNVNPDSLSIEDPSAQDQDQDQVDDATMMNAASFNVVERDFIDSTHVDGDVLPSECPNSIQASLDVGSIDTTEAGGDPSYQELQGMRFRTAFKRLSRGCTFRADTDQGTFYLQFRTRSNGQWLAVIEGYTSSGKLFSIRGVISKSGREQGEAQIGAHVYESSTSSRSIADADLELDLD